jgi:hypothetical protein
MHSTPFCVSTDALKLLIVLCCHKATVRRKYPKLKMH